MSVRIQPFRRVLPRRVASSAAAGAAFNCTNSATGRVTPILAKRFGRLRGQVVPTLGLPRGTAIALNKAAGGPNAVRQRSHLARRLWRGRAAIAQMQSDLGGLGGLRGAGMRREGQVLGWS